MRQAVMRQVKLILVILVGYLAHVSIMPYLNIGGITPNLLIVTTAIVTVGYGILRGVWIGMFYGIIMEVMLPKVPMLNLLLYPITALFCSAIFADRSEAQLQYARSIGKRGRNISPLLRTVLCAAVNIAVHEVIMLVYMYLSGAELSGVLLRDSLISILITSLLTAVLMVPVRKLLGFRKPEETREPEFRFDNRPARD